MAIHVLQIHSPIRGHDVFNFDTENEATLVGAAKVFNEQVMEKKSIAAKKLADGKSKLIRKFDPTAEVTTFIPQLKGG
jgi:hypothetical protein